MAAYRPDERRDWETNVSGKFLGALDYGEERAVAFAVPMAHGKTQQIKKILRRKERTLILTHMCTLAADIHAEAHTDAGSELKHYALDFKTQEAKTLMRDANQLICCKSAQYDDNNGSVKTRLE